MLNFAWRRRGTGGAGRQPTCVALVMCRFARMEIRQFEHHDWDAVERIWDETEGMSTPSWDEVLRKLERDRHLFVVAEEEGEVGGVAMGTYDGRRGYIFRLAVSPNLQGRGIGSALVAELERRFDAMGVRHVRVLVHRTNPGARAFWERHGYEGVEDVMLYSKDR